MAKKTNNEDHCSFCGRPASQCSLLLTGLEGFICSECVEQANLIINQRDTKTPYKATTKKKKPMKGFFDTLYYSIRGGPFVRTGALHSAAAHKRTGFISASPFFLSTQSRLWVVKLKEYQTFSASAPVCTAADP